MATGYSVTFVVETPPASSKNRRRIFRRGSRIVSVPSRAATASKAEIASAAREAIAGADMPFADDDLLSLDVEIDVETNVVTVTVAKVGQMPRRGKKGTKRDAHGMIETIADALEGVLYPNDRAIDCGAWGRVR